MTPQKFERKITKGSHPIHRKFSDFGDYFLGLSLQTKETPGTTIYLLRK